MKIIYSLCAAMVLASFGAIAGTAQAGQINKPCVIVNNTPPQEHITVQNHRVPEPATIILLGSGLFALGAARLRK